MRCIILICLCKAVLIPSYAQKPTLPQDYFSSKIYTISPALDIKDTSAVRKEITRLADSLYLFCKHAGEDFIINDSVLRRDPAIGIAATAIYRAQYKEAYDSLLSYTKALYTPSTVNGIHFLLELQIMAHLTADASSGIVQALNKKLAAINKDFQKDNVNTWKGIFHPDYIKIFDKAIITTLQQARGAANNRIEYNNALYLVRCLALRDFLLQQHALLQQALYALDPAKVEKTEVKIPLRNGAKLSALLFRDVNTKEKLPAIVSQSPYPSGSEATRGNIFGAYGYIYLYVDSRGRRQSEGDFFPYENDAQDFYDIIDWISKQPWCNGKVATTGGSYLGFAQWQAIRKKYRHPALKAINPMVSVGFGVDFPRWSNIFYPYILQWATYVSGKELNSALFSDYSFWKNKGLELYRRHIPFSKLDSLAGLSNPFFQKWVSHPDLDNYWKDILPAREDYAALDIPVLSVTGYFDADQAGAMYYYNNHHRYGGAAAQKNHYLLIGPYDHGGAQWNPAPSQQGILIEKEAQVPIYKYVIAWFDWTLKGKAKPAWIKDKITYFATGTGQWKGTSSFGAATADTLKFYLHKTPVATEKRRTIYQLQAKPAAGQQSLEYQHNITEAIDSAFIYHSSAPDSDSFEIASPYNLMFETAPLEKDILLTDRVMADLYISLNVPDADFSVIFSEVTPAGKVKAIGSSLLRCRYRNGGDKPALMIPGKVEKLSFNDAFIYIKKIARGSKLRMEFESLNRPYYEKNYGFGGVVANETTSEPRIIKATILMGREYPACLKVPIGR